MASLNKNIDGVFCINLDRRDDRWDEFKEIWREQDIEIERFPALDGEKIKIAEGEYRNDDEHHNKYSRACALSHAQIFQRALDYGYKEILVLEDDAEPCQEFIKKFNTFYQQLPEDYNFCFLGGSNMVPPAMITENVGRAINTKSTVAYIIKLDFAKELMPTIRRYLSSFAVDEIYAYLQKEHVFHIFNPRLIHQYESYSDIIGRDIYYHWMKDLE